MSMRPCLATVMAVLMFAAPAAIADEKDDDVMERLEKLEKEVYKDGKKEKAAEEPEPVTKEGDEGFIVEARKVKSEADTIGPWGQPEWTSRRRFATTRVYVQVQPGEIEFEQWIEIRYPRGTHKNPETRLRTEFAVGLPYRFQLDLYLLTIHKRDDDDSSFDWRGFSAELRWALADWNKIPGNPTLYFEYIFLNGDSDKIEPKLLLGGDIVPKLHWGVNFVYEQTLSNHNSDKDQEWKITAGIAYGVIDKTLSIGVEIEYIYEVERERGSDPERHDETLIGPTVQWRPMDHMHLDISLLRGVEHDGKRGKIFAIFGWDF